MSSFEGQGVKHSPLVVMFTDHSCLQGRDGNQAWGGGPGPGWVGLVLSRSRLIPQQRCCRRAQQGRLLTWDISSSGMNFLTPLFTKAAVAFGPIHCRRCAILVLCGGEIPVLIHIECTQQSVRKVAVWREKSKRDFCDPYWISYFKMKNEYSMKVSE